MLATHSAVILICQLYFGFHCGGPIKEVLRWGGIQPRVEEHKQHSAWTELLNSWGTLGWNAPLSLSALIIVWISVCNTALPPKPTAGEHTHRHLTTAFHGGPWSNLYRPPPHSLSPFSSFFYSKQKIVPNSLLLEGGNLWLMAERRKPQIWKSCCGKVVFYECAPSAWTASEKILN